MILPDLFFLLVKSISLAAADSTYRPGVLQPWVDEIEKYVHINGKFSQFAVAYFPLSPPPFFWDYKCKKCFWWIEPDACKVVEGKISPWGWSALWVPPSTYKAFTWAKELLKGDW